MAREADAVLTTLAGPEIGVASTKAFTTQLAVLACFTLALGRARGTIDQATEARLSKRSRKCHRALPKAPTSISRETSRSQSRWSSGGGQRFAGAALPRPF